MGFRRRRKPGRNLDAIVREKLRAAMDAPKDSSVRLECLQAAERHCESVHPIFAAWTCLLLAYAKHGDDDPAALFDCARAARFADAAAELGGPDAALVARYAMVESLYIMQRLPDVPRSDLEAMMDALEERSRRDAAGLRSALCMRVVCYVSLGDLAAARRAYPLWQSATPTPRTTPCPDHATWERARFLVRTRRRALARSLLEILTRKRSACGDLSESASAALVRLAIREEHWRKVRDRLPTLGTDQVATRALALTALGRLDRATAAFREAARKLERKRETNRGLKLALRVRACARMLQRHGARDAEIPAALAEADAHITRLTSIFDARAGNEYLTRHTGDLFVM